jgi:hypothetical protein
MKLIAPCRIFKIRTYVYSLDEAWLLDEAELLVEYLDLMHQFYGRSARHSEVLVVILPTADCGKSNE